MCFFLGVGLRLSVSLGDGFSYTLEFGAGLARAVAEGVRIGHGLWLFGNCEVLSHFPNLYYYVLPR